MEHELEELKDLLARLIALTCGAAERLTNRDLEELEEIALRAETFGVKLPPVPTE